MANDNIRLVTDLFARMRAGDVRGMLQLFAEDATWLVPGKPERFPTAGTFDRERFGRLIERMRERGETELLISITRIVADGDQLAVEAEASMDLKNGRKYRQNYHFAIECRDGKVGRVREYLDTQHSHDVWFAT
jgi:ketosteroid isomerase-like protein